MIENRLKKGLGRGLSSLLGDSSKNIETNKVSINDITRNKFQPRKNFDQGSLDRPLDFQSISFRNSITGKPVFLSVVLIPLLLS